MSSNSFVIWIADVDLDSRDDTKSPTKRLAKLKQAEFPIPPGFVITSYAYTHFLKENNLDYKIKQLLSTIAIDRPESLMQGEHHIRKLFEQAKLSDEFKEKLSYFYQQLGRSTITLSLHERQLQGRKHITLQANTKNELLALVKDAWAVMFTGNALWHRHNHHVDHLSTENEIIVQEKITGSKNGTIITIDPQTHEKEKIVIITTKPHEGDRYMLSKKNLSIIDRKLNHTTNVPKLSHDEILAIGELGKRLENFLYFPQEISWAIEEDTLYIIKTKPFNDLIKQQKNVKRKLPLARGKGVTKTIGTGVVHIIDSLQDLSWIKSHDVVVVSHLEAKHLPHFRKVQGVIVETQPFTNEVVIVLKQHGIPTIINVKQAKKRFQNGYVITVNGEKGEIYLGGLL